MNWYDEMRRPYPAQSEEIHKTIGEHVHVASESAAAADAVVELLYGPLGDDEPLNPHEYRQARQKAAAARRTSTLPHAQLVIAHWVAGDIDRQDAIVLLGDYPWQPMPETDGHDSLLAIPPDTIDDVTQLHRDGWLDDKTYGAVLRRIDRQLR